MKKLTILGASIAFALISQQAQAKGGIDIDQLVSKSDLIFKGTITDVSYKDSKEGLPHTFVTYQIKDLMSGKTDKTAVTLRFIGGKQQKGKVIRYLHVSDIPDFEKGASDVLFVSKNNTSICPLVQCSQGRFRDLNGLITNEDGQPLLLDENNSYRLSRKSMADQLGSTNRKGGMGRSISDMEGEEPLVDDKNSSMVDTAEFVDSIKERIELKKSKGDFNPEKFKSASIKSDFSVPLFKATAPRADSTISKTLTPAAKPTTQKSQFDQWEEKMLNRNGGDPILNNPDVNLVNKEK